MLPDKRASAFSFRAAAFNAARRSEDRLMPPLLQLRDIALTFGGAALLRGRSCPSRRATGSRSSAATVGQVDAAADCGGAGDPGPGNAILQPTARLAYLPQEPDLSGFATALDYVLAGLGEHDDEYAARGMMAELGLDPAVGSDEPFGRRGETGGAGAGSSARAGNPSARRADQPSRPDRDRMARSPARRLPVGAGARQPRQAPALPT